MNISVKMCKVLAMVHSLVVRLEYLLKRLVFFLDGGEELVEVAILFYQIKCSREISAVLIFHLFHFCGKRLVGGRLYQHLLNEQPVVPA